MMQTYPSIPVEAALLLLGIDTCGPAGSVALGLVRGGELYILGESHLGGRTYAATLVSSVCEMLGLAEVGLPEIDAIVAVNGPGSFTGVRVGLSAVKGLAESTQIPVVAVSRLEVLAAKAGTGAAALDAHRQEVFLRLGETAGGARELLAGAEELAGLAATFSEGAGGAIAVCDEAAELLLRSVWPGAELVRTDAPKAADALRLCAARAAAGEFADLVLLDGNYLRRSDAEIFGEPEAPGQA
jgi:tRNA threonylcarbamoyladenosine biosynthesis protein TsaB